MSTGWTAALDILEGAADRLSRIVDEMSGGRFRIEVFPGGQIMPPFECFDATSQGQRSTHTWPSPQHRSAKEPALEWFGTVPFGMNPLGMAAGHHQGEGRSLMEEAYASFKSRATARPSQTLPQMGLMVPEEDQRDRATTRD